MIDKLPYGFINSVYGFNDYTLNELICKIAQKMDEVITQSNESFNYLDWLKDEGAPNYIIELLTQWKDDGTLDAIINDKLFNELNNKIENTKNEVNSQIENTKSEVNSQIENTKSEVNSQLGIITNQRLTTITPQMFGCVGDGITDDTKGLQDAINYCIENDSMLSSDGSKKYLVASTINIEGNLNINFNMATITTNNPNIGVILKFNNASDKQCEVNNLRIDCNRLTITAIQIDLLRRKFFNNIEITLCLGYGFKILSGYEIFINKSSIKSPSSIPNNAYGIYIITHDCHFTDIVMRDVKNAVYSKGSNFFTRVHPWIMSKEVILGSICFYISDTIFMSDCYGDSYETVFFINGYKTLNLTNFIIQNVI